MQGSESMDIQYDRHGRMMYHPDFHPNHKKPFSDYDLAYMCYYYERDGRKNVGLALGRTESTIASQVTRFKKEGLYEHYCKLWEYIQTQDLMEEAE